MFGPTNINHTIEYDNVRVVKNKTRTAEDKDLSALEPEDEIDITRIQRELKAHEGEDVPLEEIREVLVKLSRGDLLEYMEFGGWFRKVKDPILLQFLKAWGRIQVERQNPNVVREELEIQYQHLKRKYSEYKGYLAEVFMSQVLLNGQRKTLPGEFFNSEQDIDMPRFIYVSHRVRPAAGKHQEIDLLGAAGIEQWVCQSKWVEGKKAGVKILQQLKNQAERVVQQKNADFARIWLFAHEGLTQQAEKYAKEQGILWSSRREFDNLLEYLGLRKLPEL